MFHRVSEKVCDALSQPLGIDLVLGESTEKVNLCPLHLLQKHGRIRFLGQLPLDGIIAVSVHQMRITLDKKYGSCGSGLGVVRRTHFH